MHKKPVLKKQMSRQSGSVVCSLEVGRLSSLRAMAVVLANQLDESARCRTCQDELGSEPPAAKAALVKELRALLAEIAELEGLEQPKELSGFDEIARRRQERIAAARVDGSSVRRVRKR